MQGNLGANRRKSSRKPAATTRYVSPNQLTICGFETPFEQKLTKQNRWVQLGELIPWDRIVKFYDVQFTSTEGRPPINGRIVIGAVIIKHMLNLTDRETINQISENPFMQYFLGLSSFTNEAPFSHTLFGSIRQRLSLEVMNSINSIILSHNHAIDDHEPKEPTEPTDTSSLTSEQNDALPAKEPATDNIEPEQLIKNSGTLMMDATVAPQYITYPTDLKLVNASRMKTEELIDKLYDKFLHAQKPRTYRDNARKAFVNLAKKKKKRPQEIHKAIGQQLRCIRRNLAHIQTLLIPYETNTFIENPLEQKDIIYIDTIQKILEQQWYMHTHRVRRVENRIVNLHQPHVRAIVRGKDKHKVEFGSKLQASLVNGYCLIDKLSWDNFNEGTCFKDSIQLYYDRFRCYPKTILADQIYCNRENRQYAKQLGIDLKGKKLGRPSTNPALQNHVRPGERNPIEGKFGQAKVAYGLDCIKAKYKSTSESWIAAITLVLNLVNLTRQALVSIIESIRLSLFGRWQYWLSL